MKTRVWSVAGVVVLVMATGTTGVVLTGCAGTVRGGDERLVNTGQLMDVPAFIAPHDVSMGRVVLMVPDVKVSAGVPGWMGDLGQTVRTQLVHAMTQSPNLVIADREVMGAIASEHRLADGGAVQSGTGPAAGMLASAQYVVQADVSEFDEQVVGNSEGTKFEAGGILGAIGGVVTGIGGRILGGLGAANPTIGGGTETVTGIVGLDVRVTDVATGVVIYATRAHVKLTRQNTKRTLGIAGVSTTSSEFQNSVVSQATRAAAEEATRRVHAMLRGRVVGTVAVSESVLAGR